MKPLQAVGFAGCMVLGARGARAAEEDAQPRSAVLFKEAWASPPVRPATTRSAEVAFRTSYRPCRRARRFATGLNEDEARQYGRGALQLWRVALASSGWTPEQRAIVRQNFDDAYAATGHLSVKTAAGADRRRACRRRGAVRRAFRCDAR